MKLHSIVPVHAGEEEIARRQARYDLLTKDLSVEVVLHDLPGDVGAPVNFDTVESIESSDAHVIAAGRRLAESGHIAILPDCILDPGLEEIDRVAASGAFGILRLTVAMLEGLGLRYGAVARNDAIKRFLDERIRSYDARDLFVGTAVLGLPTEAVANSAWWDAAVAGATEDLMALGAEVVINGCSAVAVNTQSLSLPIVDPTKLALQMLDIAGRNGLRRS